MRALRLLRLGVSLTEQGLVTREGEVPAVIADWLIELVDAENELAVEKRAEAARAAELRRRGGA